MEQVTSLRRPSWRVFVIAVAILLLSTDERFFGGIRDGKEMLSAAFALSHYGEIGVSRQFENAAPGPGGDAYSRYGMGTSVAETIPMTVTRAVRSVLPGVPSGPIFALLPILSLAAAAAFTSATATLLGTGPLLAGATGLALVFASPLWGYAGSDYSEPLQALTLSLSLFAVVRLRILGGSWKWELAAGGAAGYSVLLKSLNIVPAALLVGLVLLQRIETPGNRQGRKKNETVVMWRARFVLAISFGTALLLWGALEVVRFGKLFGGYPGEDFPYPFWTGLLRLTLFPNKGLLVYSPLLFLVPFGFVTLWKKDRLLAGVAASCAASYFAIASAWWAWDGQAGWGPRLVVPAIPFLFLFVSLAIQSARRPLLAVAGALAAAGLCVNLTGALVPFGSVYLLAGLSEPQPISEARAEGTPYEVFRRSDGTLLATGGHHLSLSPSWWPPRVHARLAVEGIRGGDVAGRLTAGALGDLEPPFLPKAPRSPGVAYDVAVAPFRWPFWGRSWLEITSRRIDPYRNAMRDQLLRATSKGSTLRAESLRAGLGADAPPAMPGHHPAR